MECRFSKSFFKHILSQPLSVYDYEDIDHVMFNSMINYLKIELKDPTWMVMIMAVAVIRCMGIMLYVELRHVDSLQRGSMALRLLLLDRLGTWNV